MYTIADVFYDSTPANKNAKPWRCAGKDRLVAVLLSMGYSDDWNEGAYVSYTPNGKGLIVGLRGRFWSLLEHKRALEALGARLKSKANDAGCSLKIEVIDGGSDSGYILLTE